MVIDNVKGSERGGVVTTQSPLRPNQTRRGRQQHQQQQQPRQHHQQAEEHIKEICAFLFE